MEAAEAEQGRRAALASAAAQLRRVHIDVFVDDYIAVGDRAALKRANSIMEREGLRLGLEFAPDKDEIGVELEVLGVWINGNTLRMSISPKKH